MGIVWENLRESGQKEQHGSRRELQKWEGRCGVEKELCQGLCHKGAGPMLELSLILGKPQLENHSKWEPYGQLCPVENSVCSWSPQTSHPGDTRLGMIREQMLGYVRPLLTPHN